MTDRAIIAIAVCALLAVCVICGTILLLQRGKKDYIRHDNDTYKSIVDSIVKSDDNYSLTYGKLSSECNAGKKTITLKGKETWKQVANIGAKIAEFIIKNTKREK